MNAPAAFPEAKPWLDDLRSRLEEDDRPAALRELYRWLQDSRDRLPKCDWRRLVEGVLKHEIRELVHLDPMTRRSFEKPRGYAGDAVLLDFLYRKSRPDTDSPLVRELHEFGLSRVPVRAVNHRREWIAHRIDEASERTEGRARILSVACGHLREAELSSALQNGWLEELVALDADAESLSEVERSGTTRVTPLHLSISRLLTGRRREELGRFDLVYSAGLYDYLEAPVARRLNEELFALLRPGGTLLYCNFLTAVPDSGYMESFMGWELILRTLEEIEELGDGLPTSEIRRRRIYADPFGAVGYAEVEKRGEATH